MKISEVIAKVERALNCTCGVHLMNAEYNGKAGNGTVGQQIDGVPASVMIAHVVTIKLAVEEG